MKIWIAATVVSAALLTGACSKDDRGEVALLEGENTRLQQELEDARSDNETLQGENTQLNDDLRDTRAKLVVLRDKAGDAPPAPDKDEGAEKDSAVEVKTLEDKIASLEEEIEELKARANEVETDPEADEAPDETDAPDPAIVKQEIADLMPLVKAGDRKAISDLQDAIRGADKQTRDDAIQTVRDWVKDDPDNKHARLTLAGVLVTRFQDLKSPMQQGALAGEVSEEVEKALKIDPDYYEAQHFLAILKVNYPTFAPEFKSADGELDKALELQKNMTWEDRFAEIYTAYAVWYRKQGKLDDAATWAQKGLDHAPRNEGLLNEKGKIETAKAEQEE